MVKSNKCRIVTSDGVSYNVDIHKRLIEGGCVAVPTVYQEIHAELGQPLFVILQNGSFFKISTVAGIYDTSNLEKGAVEFFTAHSAYVVDYDKMTIQGGALKSPMPISHIEMLQVGNRAMIHLANGQILNTSTVQCIRAKECEFEREMC